VSDVFISYARSSEAKAQQVEQALRQAGYGVWRDAELPAHRSYAEVIEERLKSAKAVVVLWSGDAAKSQWVRAEADAARETGTMIQASVDGTVPPIPFNQVQCADLKDWSGNSDHPGWRKLAGSVEALAGRAPRLGKSPEIRRDKRSVCVLPFANMSGDPEQEYFSDGISEDITTDLSNVSALEVIARNTAFTFKGQSVDVSEIAQKLGVSHVLEGSVRKSGNRVRITAQLIDGATGSHVWAERYDRDLTDIFAIQDEISHAIVDALKIKLLPAEKKAIEQRGTNSAEAYNLYLMARQYWISDFGGRRRAETVVRLCERATEIDPDYAQAWALMAIAHAHMFYGLGANRGNNGSAAAERALALDADIAEAHLPRAWRLAEEERFDEANEEIATALRLNPDSWEVHKESARLFYRQRRLDDATLHLERATELLEADFHGWGMLSACYTAQGDAQGVQRCARKILEQVEEVLRRDPDNGMALALGGLSFAALGDVDRSRQWIERALLLEPDNLFMRYNLAYGMIARFGDRDAALDLLRPVFEKGGPSTIRLAVNDPNLDGLRGDAQFDSLLADAVARVSNTPAESGEPTPPAASSAQPRS